MTAVARLATFEGNGQDGPPASSLSPTPALQVRRLSKSFTAGGQPVFHDVTFDVPQGQSVALIGANGAGKSTLLRCCLRLVEPDSGDIAFHGTDFVAARRQALRRMRARVGFVFQKHNLVPRLSVLTNVMHGALARGVGPRSWFQAIAPGAEREKAMACLEQVGLADLADRRADRLSGGQSQRVAIARSLMQDPELMFADEPVASLDPAAGEGIMELFARLNHDRGLTLVFVSHQLDHALRYADRVLGLREGGLALDAASAGRTPGCLRGLYD